MDQIMRRKLKAFDMSVKYKYFTIIYGSWTLSDHTCKALPTMQLTFRKMIINTIKNLRNRRCSNIFETLGKILTGLKFSLDNF